MECEDIVSQPCPTLVFFSEDGGVWGKVGGLLQLIACSLQVGSHQDITEESFSLFWMLEPRIGIRI